MKTIFYIAWMLGAFGLVGYGMFTGLTALTFSEHLACLGWMLAGFIQVPIMWEVA